LPISHELSINTIPQLIKAIRLVINLIFMKSAFLVIYFFFNVFAVQEDRYSDALKEYDNKKYQASISICSSELEKLPVKDSLFSKFLSLRASSYLALRDFEPAIKDYKRLIGLYQKNVSWYVGLSYVYGESNDYMNCLSILKKALAIDKKDIYIYNNLSYYSSQLGDYTNAIKYADDGLKYVTDDYWKGTLMNNRGYGYIGLKQYDKALNDIDESIKLNSDNPFAFCYRAIANIGLKKMETVCADLTKAKMLGSLTLTADLIKQYCKN